MNNNRHRWVEDEDTIEQCEQCEDCVFPNGCIRQCAIKTHTHEDVAKIRGETPEQLFGENQ